MTKLNDTAGVASTAAPDTRKPWEKSSWTCALATVTPTGVHCPPTGRCPDCIATPGVAVPDGWRLVPLVAPPCLASLMTGYELEHLNERDRAVVAERMQARWDAILATIPAPPAAGVETGDEPTSAGVQKATAIFHITRAEACLLAGEPVLPHLKAAREALRNRSTIGGVAPTQRNEGE